MTTTTFGYNGSGDRAWQVLNGVTTTFTLDLNTALTQVLAQQGGGSTTYLLPGVGQQANGAWQYAHDDALGNLRLLSGATGQVLSSLRYSPFGEVEQQSGPQAVNGFTGEPFDLASGLIYLRARHYNPALGRFLTQDSLIPDPTNGQTWNQYAYVYNDPVNFVDPSGHIPIMLRLMGVAMGAMFASAIAESWAGQTPERSAWWNKHTDCNCVPVSSPTIAGIAMGLAPGTAAGIAYGFGGLARDVERVYDVADADIGRAKALEANAQRSGNQFLADKLKEIPKRTQINPGLAVKTELGTWAVGADGVIASGMGLDMLFQMLGDNGLCLTPRQRFYRVLLAGGLAAGVGAIGMGAGAFVLGMEAGATAAAAASVGASVLAGAVNEAFVKPRVFGTLGLQ